MSDNIDELIKEIAVKHGIAVSRDDPILILQTINNRLMQDSEKAQQGMLDHYKEEMEEVPDSFLLVFCRLYSTRLKKLCLKFHVYSPRRYI